MKTIGLLERASRGTRVREGEVRVVHIERSAVRVVPECDAESLSSRGIEQSTSGENAEVHSYRLSCPLAVTTQKEQASVHNRKSRMGTCTILHI